MNEQNEQNETQTEETADEKRKRLGRERTRKHREKHRVEEPPESFEELSAKWTDNDKQLLVSDPTLHGQLLQRHRAVEELEAEAADIEKGIEQGRRAETLSALTSDPQNVMPMPDDSYRDIKAHALTNGTANYRQIEAAAINGRQGDDLEQHYVRYGLRLRIQSDVLQQARESLVLYALRSRDASLDWNVVGEAIRDCTACRGFSSHATELRKLLQEFCSPKAPVAEAPTPIS
jgi:hypothetical protein